MKYRRYFVVFAGGLLLGWLVIGWLIWPVHWINTTPSELLPEYQKIYIGMVAKDYWNDRNIGLVRDAFNDWDDQSLAKTLEQMMDEATSAEEIKQLSEIARIMMLPDATLSLWDMFFEPQNRMLLLTTAFAFLLVAGAIMLGLSTAVQTNIKPRKIKLAEFQDEEKPLVFDENGEPIEEDEWEPGPTRVRDDSERLVDGNDELFDYTEEYEVGPDDTSINPDEESDEASEEDDDGEGGYDTETLDFDYDDDDDEVVETSTGALFSFFDEEESIFPELEALCRDLPELDMDELVKYGMQVAYQFRKGLIEQK